MARRFDAVLFDLLTALVDSWSLWNRVAGDAEAGRRWRDAYLRRTYAAGQYRPYETLVAEAAAETALPERFAIDLAAADAGLEPWPEVPAVPAALRARFRLGIVTNCSARLGRLAAARTGGEFAVVVTAERAGFYKPHPQPYRMALAELEVKPEHCLFVAGSPYDLFGTAKLGLATYWHDRIGMMPPSDMPAPLRHESSLRPLVDLLRTVAKS